MFLETINNEDGHDLWVGLKDMSQGEGMKSKNWINILLNSPEADCSN